jgi:hypothetical protein
MAKRNKKPQRQPKAASAIQPAASSPLNRSPHKANGPTTNLSSKWRGKLYDHCVEFVAGGIAVLFLGLWVAEFREHEGTRNDLRHEKGLKETAIAERDQFKKDAEDLRREIADLNKRLPNLQLYGRDTDTVVNFDLKTDIGRWLQVGSCIQAPCFRITLLNLEKGSGGIPERVIFGVSGIWEGMSIQDPTLFPVGLPLKKGCYFPLLVPGYIITLVIEDSDVTFLRAGVRVEHNSNNIRGIELTKLSCPAE